MRRAPWTRALEQGLLVVLVAGCAPLQQPQSPPAAARVNLTGFPPAFKDGYADGCESAGAHRPRRQESRYKSDDQYKRGWNDGYSACQRR